ncbi:RNA ligase [Pendulispora rubella]|uniref:RNA ligase n=1 Tax=Pendulispora rubella TaxID=2741070 RepID=A0ABZ2LGG6_9BACT
MEHRPFPKIPLHPRDAAPSKASRWVATEKIHGAHVVIGTDGVSVHFGKRKSWLGAGDAFFGWQLLRSPLEIAAREVHRRVGRRGPMYLYGELYGGAYPHPDVTPMRGVSAVQTGIWYAPDIQFALFDILVDDGVFLAHSKLDAFTQGTALRLVPTLLEGTRAEVSALAPRFETRVPRDLPALAGNFAEGLVLKPDADLAPSDRPVFKVKIPEFSEVRFDESVPWNSGVRLSEDELQMWAARLVNPPRLASAHSKVGDDSLEALLDEVVLDVLIDLEAAFPRAMGSLAAAEEERLRAHIGELARKNLEEGGLSFLGVQ